MIRVLAMAAIAAAWLCAGVAPAAAHVCDVRPPALEGIRADALRALCDSPYGRDREPRAILIDFGELSGKQRLFVLDLADGRIISSHWTTHGIDSDDKCRFVQAARDAPRATVTGPYRIVNESAESDGGPFFALQGLTDATRAAVARGVRIAPRDYVRSDPQCPLAPGQRLPGRSHGGFMVGDDAFAVLRRSLAAGGGPEGVLVFAVPP